MLKCSCQQIHPLPIKFTKTLLVCWSRTLLQCKAISFTVLATFLQISTLLCSVHENYIILGQQHNVSQVYIYIYISTKISFPLGFSLQPNTPCLGETPLSIPLSNVASKACCRQFIFKCCNSIASIYYALVWKLWAWDHIIKFKSRVIQ